MQRKQIFFLHFYQVAFPIVSLNRSLITYSNDSPSLYCPCIPVPGNAIVGFGRFIGRVRTCDCGNKEIIKIGRPRVFTGEID